MKWEEPHGTSLEAGVGGLSFPPGGGLVTPTRSLSDVLPSEVFVAFQKPFSLYRSLPLILSYVFPIPLHNRYFYLYFDSYCRRNRCLHGLPTCPPARLPACYCPPPLPSPEHLLCAFTLLSITSIIPLETPTLGIVIPIL